MGIVRLLGRLFRWSVAAYVLMTVALILWTFTWPEPNTDSLAPADAIVCLAGGMSADGTLEGNTLGRVDRCVELYEAGVAPVIILSGGPARPDGPTAAEEMMRYAIGLGAPEAAMIQEDRSYSTLQNALFSLEMGEGRERYVIVTEGFHLPRSYFSFVWATRELDLQGSHFTLVMSQDVYRDPLTGRPEWSMLIRESLAIWFNLVRATIYTLALHPNVNWLR